MQIIAHRGASAYAPENTLAAFRLALEMGAKAIEFDVHQTRDGKLVVMHDDNFKRVAGRKLRVRRLNLSEARKFDVGSWFDPIYKKERLPTLEEVLGLIGRRAELYIEIKAGSRRYPGIEGRVVDLVRKRGLAGRAVISSFDHKALYEARALAPELRIGILMGLTPFRLTVKSALKLDAESFHLSLRKITPGRLKFAQERGLRVLVYTVNAAGDLERLEDMGVDGVFSNHPDIAS